MSIARHFTAQVNGMAGLDYWEQLESLHLYSQERRRERYEIIFIWKVAQGLTQGYPATFTQSERRGRQMILSPLCNSAPALVRRAREASLQVKGAKLFNIIPRTSGTFLLAPLSFSKPDLMTGSQQFLTSLPFLVEPELQLATHYLTKYSLYTCRVHNCMRRF